MENKVTIKDIIMVKNLIERCMQVYMTRKQVVNKLQNKAKIEPEFTETVWQRLEEQNPKFFKSYYTRLALKQQIEQFNKLLDKQKQLMDEEQTKVASLPSQNSNLGLQQGINRGMTISVPECSSSSPHMFGYDGKISKAGPNVDNASATPITNAKSTLHSVNESVMDYPYTYLNEPLSREFSLSDMPDYMFSDFPLDFDDQNIT